MKKQIKYLVLIPVWGTLIYLAYSIARKLEHKKQVLENIKKIPGFCIYNLDNTEFCSQYISNESSCLIVYFNPGCHYCQYEAEQIFIYNEDFKHYQIFMISDRPIDELNKFAEKYYLNEFDNITFLYDMNGEFNKKADVSGVPTTYIYNKNRELVKYFIGEVRVEALLKYLRL